MCLSPGGSVIESRNPRPRVALNNTRLRKLVRVGRRALWSPRFTKHTNETRTLMGRNLFALSIALGAILFQATASAATPEFQIAPRIGVGSLKVKEFVGVNDRLKNIDTFGIGASVGYLTPIGVVAEIGADTYADFDFYDSFDSYQLTQR